MEITSTTPVFIVPVQKHLQHCKSLLSGMVLPRKITSHMSDLLMDEMLEAFLDADHRDTLFPSDDWLDDLWVYEPVRREKIRSIFTHLSEGFHQELEAIEASTTVRMMRYDKILYRGGSVAVSKR